MLTKAAGHQTRHSVQTQGSRRPLLIAALLALLLHLMGALALAALDWSPRPQARGSERVAEAIPFELLPTPASPSVPPSAPPSPSAPDTTPQLPEVPEATIADSEQPKLEPEPEPEPKPKSASPAEPTTTQTAETSPARPPPRDALAPAPAPKRQISAADILASRNQALASLTQQPLRSMPGTAATHRRKAINANTQDYIYANYLESWRRKVERIGNLNYPEEAKEKRLFGSLVLQVSVRADGSLEGVRVLRSSGHQVLDQAAVRIVELAAPFAPFPKDIRAHHDVLDITRTWQFMRNQKLGWDQ
ncbi:energy transducer TonB [Rhabdochromatium marinum]|uniref:energy transducer TonB n=1 Tax=Rhabdochromatium marinum TaxID=48729 RepID=UPI0019044408|nr:energy transducer TonB [Rhabdochromatium marinum]MBK1649982.1 hypothetical protein [Rhabdochromatium marinum]